MRFFARVILPLLLFIYIAIETYLKLNHTSLCETTGCKLAGELLKFNPLYLNYLGLSSALFLSILGYFSLKSKLVERLFFMVLYSAIAFEATLLGYQFISNPEPCIFCLGIFSSLLLIALLSHIKNFPFIFSIALSIFLALSILAIPQNKSFVTQDGVYLIGSKTCVHCNKVKDYFTQNSIKYIPISVQEASARNFLKFAGITTIPVLVTKKGSLSSLLVGDEQILSSYKNKSVTSSTPPVQSGNTHAFPSTFLKKGGKDGGCAVSIIETPSCDKNSTDTTSGTP